MKVSQVLEVSSLQGSKVIAGEAGLGEEVLHVNMMDAPDIAQFLKPNEMLVTTAYHVREDPESLVKLVENMKQQKCAALGIKTQRFLKEVPSEVTNTGNALDFPIIEIPIDNSLGDIVNEILSRILDKRTNELRFALETHKQFSDHVMSGKGVDKLIKSLASKIHRSVVLLDQYGKPITYSNVNDFNKSSVQELYFNDSAVHFPDEVFFTFSTTYDRETYSAFLVNSHKKRAGFLLILGEIQASDHVTMLTIEQATNVISFELMRENELKQYTKRVKNDFFFNFIEGMFTSEEEVVNRAKEFSLNQDQNYLCATGKIEDYIYTKSYTQSQKEIDEIYEYIEDEIVGLSLSTHLFTKGDLCVLLFEVNDSIDNIRNYAETSLELVQKKVDQRFHRSLSFGVSNISRGLLNVKNGFKEAQNAYQSGRLAAKSKFIQIYQAKDVNELLRTLPKEDLLDFYYHSLEPLLRPGEDKDEVLLQTLFVFLETHCQISETAKRLFVHRNTVVYRIEKCEELLGESLSDSETTIQLRLALRIKRLLEE